MVEKFRSLFFSFTQIMDHCHKSFFFYFKEFISYRLETDEKFVKIRLKFAKENYRNRKREKDSFRADVLRMSRAVLTGIELNMIIFSYFTKFCNLP